MMAVLEGRRILTHEGLHDALSDVLALPDYYGRNLDALWDCLTGWIDATATIIWRDYAVSREALGEYGEKAGALLREAASQVEGLSVRLE